MASKLDIINKNEIDAAWRAKDYGKVLSLLKEGYFFPNHFTIESLEGDAEDQQLLKQFVEERIKLHDYVREGNLDEVKKLMRNKSGYYLNPINQSAAFAAIDSGNYAVYAYLKSRNVNLLEEEESIINSLSEPQKNNLQEVLRLYFPQDYDAPIFYLMSKSRAANLSDENFGVKMLDYYVALYKIIPKILQVVQYANNLEIEFDFNKNDVNDINLLIPKKATGATSDKTETIQIAAGFERKENEILGTLAHELTHLAMNIVFKNNRKPYKKSDKKNEDVFTRLTESIGKDVEKFSGDPAQRIKEVYTCGYQKNELEGELIVRIPHILAQFEELGKKWVEKNVSELFIFYNEQVILNCEKFIKESFLIKPRSIVRSLNETIGEISAVKKHKLFFKNHLNSLEKFLEDQNKKIFFLVAKNTRLSLFRILQALYSHDYVDHYDNYIVLKIETCINYWREIEIAFFSKSVETLIIECCSESNDELLKQGIEKTVNLFTKKTSKKVIFVTYLNTEEIIQGKLTEEPLKKLGTKLIDTDFSLDDLENESQKEFLKKKVQFQEILMTLDELLCKDKNLYKMIGSEEIEKLHKKELIVVTDEKFGTSSLEGAYADVLQRIDIQSMLREIKESKNFFIFTGTDKLIQKEMVKLSCYFKTEIFTREDFENQIIDVTNLKECKITSKRIFLAKNNPSDEDFKKFCQNNDKKILIDKKKVYFISVKKNEDYHFILQCIYNPNFYMQRKIKETDDFNNQDATKSIPSEFANATLNENNCRNYSQYEYESNLFNNHQINQPFDFKNNSQNRILMNETDLINKISSERVLIIADDPGMGKSTTITRLYESELISRNNWIIRINLKDHINTIREFNSNNLTKRSFLKFLPNLTATKKTLAEIFFHVSMDSERDFSNTLLITFDGFDELPDLQDRQRTIYLLTFLKNETKSRIWIATRRQHKIELEKVLSTSATEFHPIDKPATMLFIKKYFTDRLNLIWSEEQFKEIFGNENEIKAGTKISDYIQKFIKKMDSTFTGKRSFFMEGQIHLNVKLDNINRKLTVERIIKTENMGFREDSSSFFGTPLQLNLMLENSIEKFVEWINGIENNVDFSYLGKNFLEVYENYIGRKYEIYFKKKNINEKIVQKFIKNNLEMFHEDLAESYIKNKEVQKFVKKYRDLIFLVGLIRFQNKNLQFFHFTFREYYSARFFVKYLTKKMSRKSDFCKIINHVIKNIFALQEYYLLRRFINYQLEKIDIKKWNRLNLQMFDQILLILCRKENFDLTAKVCDNLGRTILHITVEENNTNIFHLLFSRLILNYEISECIHWLEFKDSFGRNLLHLAANNGNLQICNMIFETIHKFSRKEQKSLLTAKTALYQTSFHLAVNSGDLKTVAWFVEKIKKLIPEKKQENFLMLKTKNDDNVITLAVKKNKSEIIKYLLDGAGNIFVDMKKLLKAKGAEQMSVFHQVVLLNNSEILNFLLETAEKLYPLPHELYNFYLHQAIDKRTILHLAAVFGNVKIMDTILEKINIFPPDKQFGIIMAQDINGLTSFRAASRSQRLAIMEMLFKKAESTFPNDLYKFVSSASFSYETTLHCAAGTGDYETTVWLLEKAKAVLGPADQVKFIAAKDKDSKTALHYALYDNHWSICKALLKYADMIFASDIVSISDFILVEDNLNSTALDLAAWKNIEIFITLFEKTNKKHLPPEKLELFETFLESNNMRLSSPKKIF